MEVDSAIEMFSCFEDFHNVKYVNYIVDGDSKTFERIIDAYKNVTICKKECINHVQKRVDIRFRNLKKNTKGLSEKDKLTGKLIELTVYYGLAICRIPSKKCGMTFGQLFITKFQQMKCRSTINARVVRIRDTHGRKQRPRTVYTNTSIKRLFHRKFSMF